MSRTFTRRTGKHNQRRQHKWGTRTKDLDIDSIDSKMWRRMEKPKRKNRLTTINI